VTGGALELLVALETPNVSKISIFILLLAPRRLTIEVVLSSFCLIRFGRQPRSEAVASGAGVVDIEVEVGYSPLLAFCGSSVAAVLSEGFGSAMVGVSSLGPPNKTIRFSPGVESWPAMVSG